MRDVAFCGDDLLYHALVVHDDFWLFQIEVDRTAAPPTLMENLEQLAHRFEHGHELLVSRNRRLVVVGQNGVHLGVRHARVAVNYPVVDFVPHDGPLLVDFHETGLDQAVDVRIQAAEPGRQLGWKHVHGALGKIDRCPALVRFLVQSPALWNVMRHVGNVNAEPVVALRKTLDRNRVVKIARMLSVDRYRESGPEVRPTFDVAILHAASEALRLLDRLGSVLVRQPVLADDDFVVDARLVDVAEHLDDAAERTARRRRPARNFYDNHVAGLRVPTLVRWNLDIYDQPSIERDEETHARVVDVEPAHDGRGAALQDSKDASFCPVFTRAFDPRHDPIAVHGLIEVAPRDEDVSGDPFDRPVGHDETEAPRVRLHPADDQVHQVRQTESVATRLNQVAGGNELLQQAPDGRPLIPWNLEPLKQLSRGRRMVDLLAH